MQREVLVLVHGGAGGVPAPERAARRRVGIDVALAAGLAVLVAGGSAVDAVCAAVVVLEDDPVFNAGRGGVATADGTHELDAAVMDGGDRRAGAVAAITRVKNPILAARAVMEDGRHVLFAGDALPLHLEAAPPGWFDVTSDPGTSGTVGAVALDRDGHVAAATSTGGRSGQLPGRVGDSPLIGAGTYANDATCAVSGTGAGEMYVRAVFAHSVHMAMLAGASLAEACDRALADVGALGGSGGCIAVTADGEIATPFTTDAMAFGIARHG